MADEHNISNDGDGAALSAEEQRLEALLSEVPRRRSPRRVRENVMAALRGEADGGEVVASVEADKAEVVTLWFRRRIRTALQVAAVVVVGVVGAKIYDEVRQAADVEPSELGLVRTDTPARPDALGSVPEDPAGSVVDGLRYSPKKGAPLTSAKPPVASKDSPTRVRESAKARGLEETGGVRWDLKATEGRDRKSATARSGSGIENGREAADVSARLSKTAPRKPFSGRVTPRPAVWEQDGVSLEPPVTPLKSLDDYAAKSERSASWESSAKRSRTSGLAGQKTALEDSGAGFATRDTQFAEQAVVTAPESPKLPDGDADRLRRERGRMKAAQARPAPRATPARRANARRPEAGQRLPEQVNGAFGVPADLEELVQADNRQRSVRRPEKEGEMLAGGRQTLEPVEGPATAPEEATTVAVPGGDRTPVTYGVVDFDNLEFLEVVSPPSIQKQIALQNSIGEIKTPGTALGELQREDGVTTWAEFLDNTVASFNTLVEGFGGVVNSSQEVVVSPGDRRAVMVQCTVPDQNADTLIAAVNQKRLLALRGTDEARSAGAGRTALLREEGALDVAVRGATPVMLSVQTTGAHMRKVNEDELTTPELLAVSNFFIQTIPAGWGYAYGDERGETHVLAALQPAPGSTPTITLHRYATTAPASITAPVISAVPDLFANGVAASSPTGQTEKLFEDKTLETSQYARIQAPVRNRVLYFIIEPDTRLQVKPSPPAAAAGTMSDEE